MSKNSNQITGVVAAQASQTLHSSASKTAESLAASARTQ